MYVVVRDTFSHANLKLNLRKASENGLSERNDTARPLFEKDGKLIPNTELVDQENVRLKEEIEIYFKHNVSESRHTEGRDEESDAEIKQIENEIL